MSKHYSNIENYFLLFLLFFTSDGKIILIFHGQELKKNNLLSKKIIRNES